MSAQEVEMNSIKHIKSVLKIKVVQGDFFFLLYCSSTHSAVEKIGNVPGKKEEDRNVI